MKNMKPDYANLQTEKELAKLEKSIAKVYKEARDELEATVQEYFLTLMFRDAEYKKLLESGQITEEQYRQWRLNQIGRGERFEALRDLMAERYTSANEVAISYVNDATPGIYSLNRNYEAYTIELSGKDASFILFNEQTVKRLIVEAPDLMPYYPKLKALKRGIDLAYGKKQITAAVTSGILQGKSIQQISDDLQKRISNMNQVSAVRTARTAVTQAQNAGRMDTMDAADKMGIPTYKKWIAVKDNRTRHAHQKADGLDPVRYDEPFVILGEKLMFPGDSSHGASGWNIYNCRCRMRTVEKPGIEAEPRMIRIKDPKTGRYEVVKDMSYDEWAAWKKSQQPEEFEIYMKMGRNMSADKKQYKNYKEILGSSGPTLFAEFQDIKYNHPDEWKKLKEKVRKEKTLDS